jgi:hypothetical protein
MVKPPELNNLLCKQKLREGSVSQANGGNATRACIAQADNHQQASAISLGEL